MADDKKVIFSMTGVTKTYSRTGKTVLKDIYLSFFYGAKIGILGLNGAGKSTLLRIIAGVEKEYQGEVVFAPGYTVGYLPQDPQLDPDKTVLDIVKEGVADTVAILDEYNRINEQFGLEEVYSDPDKMDALTDGNPANDHKNFGGAKFFLAKASYVPMKGLIVEADYGFNAKDMGGKKMDNMFMLKATAYIK